MDESNRAETSEQISGYLDGELSPEERARAERALEQDPALKRDLAQWRRIDAPLDKTKAIVGDAGVSGEMIHHGWGIP